MMVYRDSTECCLDVKFMLLHDQKSEDSIKQFFTEVYELYVKVKRVLPGTLIASKIDFLCRF